MDFIIELLLYSLIINTSVLLIWFILFLTAHNFIYKIHNIFFKISQEEFDKIHYNGLAFFKLAILIFNLAPYLSLLIMNS